MINSIRGIGNIENSQYTERQSKKVRKQGKNKKMNGGVVIEISTNREIFKETGASERAEKIKKLIKEGKYSVDLQKLSEKLIHFFTDV
jgi:anti-sigma28 factor (negative regulator of flagellin synthesis)